MINKKSKNKFVERVPSSADRKCRYMYIKYILYSIGLLLFAKNKQILERDLLDNIVRPRPISLDDIQLFSDHVIFNLK